MTKSSLATLEFKLDKRFGGRFIPSNDSAKLLAQLMKRSTLTHDNIQICKSLNFIIKETK